MFSVGDRVYWILNYSDEMPRIKEGVVAKQDTPLITERLITVVDAKKPDARLLWEFLEPEQLSHTIAGALTMLNKTIDARIIKLHAAIDELIAYREAQNKG